MGKDGERDRGSRTCIKIADEVSRLLQKFGYMCAGSRRVAHSIRLHFEDGMEVEQ